MAEQYGWSLTSLGHVQGNSVCRGVVFREAIIGSGRFRVSHSTLQQACDGGSARHKQSAA